MNPYQTARQLAYLLDEDAYVESPTDKVWGAVRVSDGPTEKGYQELRMPFALIGIGDTVEVDEEEPNLILQEFPIIIVQMAEGDPMAERVLIGGPRAAQGESYGKGLLELEAKLMARVGKLTGADGVRAACAYTGSPPATMVQGKMIGSRKYIVKAWCTREPHFDPPVHLVASPLGGGSGSLALTWTLPPDRWDRRQIILRRAAGLVAPASPTAGTAVTLASDLATGVTDTPGLGTFSYSVWCGYTETGAASNERYSAQELGSYRTATAT